MKTRLLRRALAGAAALTLVGATAALADNLVVDGDYATPIAGNALSLGNICTGNSLTGNALMAIKRAGGGNAFADKATVTIAVVTEGDNTTTSMTDSSIALPESWVAATNNTLSGDTAAASITVNTASLSVGAYSQKVKFQATGLDTAGDTASRPTELMVTFSVIACAPSNEAPTAAFSLAPSSPVEGASVTFTDESTDTDGTIAAWSWDFGDGSTSTEASPTHAYGDDGIYEVCLTVTDDKGATDSECVYVTVRNVAPSVTSSSLSGSIDCRSNATLGLTFSDPGVNDDPWIVDIDWGDGSTGSFTTSVTGEQTDARLSHLYVLPGNFTVTATVTDKDGGVSGAAEHHIQVQQTYATTFLAPFDGSNPSNLVTNTMKNGRVVPVKVKILDECTLSYVTDPGSAVSIGVRKAADTKGVVADGVEFYADAGQSSAGTDLFRWSTDGFWIYNLDSKALSLVSDNTYRVDAYVGSVQATTDTWALLRPVK